MTVAGDVAQLLDGLEVLVVADPGASIPAMQSALTAGQLAAELGAGVWSASGAGSAHALDVLPADDVAVTSPRAWSQEGDNRIVVIATDDADRFAGGRGRGNTVVVSSDPAENEATLFARSGIADLLGDPAQAPLVPAGQWAAGTVAYSVFCAIVSLAELARRGEADIARVDCTNAMRWVNWKALAVASLGEPSSREGDAAEWPVLPCADGHVAFVTTHRDWKTVVALIGDERLEDVRFKRYHERMALRNEWMPYVAEWLARHTADELDAMFLQAALPCASVKDVAALQRDALLRHRAALRSASIDGADVVVPVAPLRMVERAHAEAGSPDAPDGQPGALPLAGTRILDLGVLTAGAGTSTLLADLGAEVIKIESTEKPDMFRFWGGKEDSPLFHFSNRSKFGVSLNLKDPTDRATFLELVRSADAVVENFRRGVLERLGLGFDELFGANPRIVVGSVSSLGADGPGTELTTFGSTLEAMSGFSAATVRGDGTPVISGPALNYPDQTVCALGAAAVVAGITRARRSGVGIHLDICQREVALWAGRSLLIDASQGHESPSPELTASGSRWAAIDESGVAVPSLNGGEALADVRQSTGTAVVSGPDGALFKGWPLHFDGRPMSVVRRAPGIGEHDHQLLQPERVS